MATLTELTAEIVSAHASGSSLTPEELLHEIKNVFNALKALDSGEDVPAAETSATETLVAVPRLTIKQAFKKDEVVCMVCGRGGFKTLKRHLHVAHDMKPGQYRKEFNIPSTQTLVAKNYSEQRKKDALDRGQGDVLAKARAVRAAKNSVVPVAKKKAPAPVIKKKITAPVVKEKAPAPALKKKPAVPAKTKAESAPAKAKKTTPFKPAAKAKK
jgi:predicted transcriptional regulator